MISLEAVPEGDLFIIQRVESHDPELRKRLIEMGFHKGTEGKVLRRAPLGDPIELHILGYDVSLRTMEARGIIVKIVPEVNK